MYLRDTLAAIFKQTHSYSLLHKYSKFWTALIFLIAVGSLIFYMAFNEERNLLNHKSITVGIVMQVERQRNSSDVFVKYKFKVREKDFTDKTGIWSSNIDIASKYLRSILVGKTFPVLFDSLDPPNSKILLEKKEYNKFGIKRPDSLVDYFIVIDSISHLQN